MRLQRPSLASGRIVNVLYGEIELIVRDVGSIGNSIGACGFNMPALDDNADQPRFRPVQSSKTVRWKRPTALQLDRKRQRRDRSSCSTHKSAGTLKAVPARAALRPRRSPLLILRHSGEPWEGIFTKGKWSCAHFPIR